MPSFWRLSQVTWWFVWTDAPRRSRSRNRYFVSAPKSTSVPDSTRVAATFCLGLRFFARSGVHSAMRSRSSVYSMSGNRGSCFRASTRFLRYSMFAAPFTNVMCGVALMKLCGSGSAPIETRYAQY